MFARFCFVALAPGFSGADIAGQAALMNLMMMQNPFFAHGLMGSGAFPTFPGKYCLRICF